MLASPSLLPYLSPLPLCTPAMLLSCAWSTLHLHSVHSAKRTSYLLRMRARARCLMRAATPASTSTWPHVLALRQRACASSKDNVDVVIIIVVVAVVPPLSLFSLALLLLLIIFLSARCPTSSGRICISNFAFFHCVATCGRCMHLDGVRGSSSSQVASNATRRGRVCLLDSVAVAVAVCLSCSKWTLTPPKIEKLFQFAAKTTTTETVENWLYCRQTVFWVNIDAFWRVWTAIKNGILFIITTIIIWRLILVGEINLNITKIKYNILKYE